MIQQRRKPALHLGADHEDVGIVVDRDDRRGIEQERSRLAALMSELDLVVSSDTSVDVVAATNMVGKLEGLTSNNGVLGTVYEDSGATTCDPITPPARDPPNPPPVVWSGWRIVGCG